MRRASLLKVPTKRSLFFLVYRSEECRWLASLVVRSGELKVSAVNSVAASLGPHNSPVIYLSRPPAPGAADIVVWGCVGVGVFGLQQPAVRMARAVLKGLLPGISSLTFCSFCSQEAKSLAGGARDMAVCISSSRSTPELKELLKVGQPPIIDHDRGDF